MFKLCRTANTKDENERLFENPEDEAKFDKLIEEAFRLYIEEEWEKEKDIVYPEHEFSERHKKQMKKLMTIYQKYIQKYAVKNVGHTIV